jgi:hypothetical protein
MKNFLAVFIFAFGLVSCDALRSEQAEPNIIPRSIDASCALFTFYMNLVSEDVTVLTDRQLELTLQVATRVRPICTAENPLDFDAAALIILSESLDILRDVTTGEE